MHKGSPKWRFQEIIRYYMPNQIRMKLMKHYGNKQSIGTQHFSQKKLSCP